MISHGNGIAAAASIAEALWNRKMGLLFLRPILNLRYIQPIATLTTDTNTAALKGVGGYGDGNNISVWDARAMSQQGRLKEALGILYGMDQRGIRIDSYTYASLLQGCIDWKALPEGKLVHAHMMETGFKADVSLETKLVIMYAKCGALVDARRVLDEMPKRNVVSWNAMIAAHSRHGYWEVALMLFYQMQRTGIPPNQFSFASVLPACANLAALERGKEIHEGIIRSGFQSDVFVGNALVDMYAKCGVIEDARQVFDRMLERNVVSWTALIAAYGRNGHGEEALTLFYQMQQTGIRPDQFALASILPICASLAALERGKKVHENIIKNGCQCDVIVGNALIDMYAKCGSIRDARQVFDRMPEQNIVSWTTMIGAYAQSGHVDEALKLFGKMPRQDLVSWHVMIAGYVQNGNVDEALKFFQKMPERNVVSWNAMIAGYVQNGHVDEASMLFHKMPRRDVLSWSAMITVFSQNGYFDEALNTFRQMHLTDAKPNSITFASVLPACANLAALQQGKEVHKHIIISGLESNVFVGSALVDMYGKCGCVADARQVFDKMPERNVVSWNAMIVTYSIHGCGSEALQFFEQMQQFGMKPDHVTFVGVLSACCHTGLVDDGWLYFNRMSQDYRITPAAEHYCCMVDLLGRAGHLDEAQEFINKMPIKPSTAVWGSMLGACRIHTNVELGEHVADYLLESEPENSANYVVLSNIYAAAGRWDDREKVRKMMKDRRVTKMPGCSWIEVNNKMYSFHVGDRSHPQTQEIYAELERLSGQLKEVGYMPETNFVLHDVEEEQKEHILCHHSERLAIAFGLINTPPGSLIRVAKNLRVCGDCHSATKFISKIVAREIVVRDASRFHHFKDGQCSCHDYW